MDILSKVVRNLYTQYGPSSIADGNTVMQTFLKQAPNARQEAASLDAFLRAGGNHELLKVLNADAQTQLQCRSWLAGKLSTQFQLPYSEAKRVVESFWSGLQGSAAPSAQPPVQEFAPAQQGAPGFAPPVKNQGQQRKPLRGMSSGAFLALCAVVLLIVGGLIWFLLSNNTPKNGSSSNQAAAPVNTPTEAAAPAEEAPEEASTEHIHDWLSATCTAPMQCASCGETQGEPLGHNWTPATRTAPKTCAACGQTEGSPLIVYYPGDIFYMGTYPQSSTSASQREPIAWIVLEFDEANNRALVISQYCLDTIPFDASGSDGIWETSTLRRWLNQQFLTTAFSPEEQDRILTTTVEEASNPSSHRSSGNSTEDQIYVLSYEEAVYYFPSDPSRQGTPTAYCKAQGCYDPVEYARSHGTEVKPEEIGHTWWWLRTPGMEASRVCNVVSKGTASTYGAEFFHNQGTIRPVMWIQLG